MLNDVTNVYLRDYYEVGATTKKYYSIGGVRVAMRDSGLASNPYFLLGDHLGSTSITADSGGSFVAEIRYKAWGESRYSNGTTPTSFHFTGQREESGIGLYFYNARWYDPSLSRFAQADTIVPGAGNPQAYNRYAYTLNNPLRYVDPSGHAAETIVDIISIAADVAAVKQDPSLANVTALVIDVGCTVVPFVPAFAGILIRGGKAIDKAVDAADAVAKATKVLDAVKATDDAVLQAYKVAKQGGRHSGTLQTYAKRTSKEIAKGIRSFDKQVEEHLQKLADPSAFAGNWEHMTDRDRERLLGFWRKEVENYQEQADVLRGLLQSMGVRQ
jgi:RHS repeat-associated protein